MEKFKSILVPTDFSETAKNAFFTALVFAQKLQAELTLAHFYHIPLPLESMGQSSNLASEAKHKVEEFRLRLLEWKHKAGFGFPEVKVSIVLQQGLLVDGLKELCQTLSADLMVMGTEGADNLGEFILGTNTTAVLKEASVPLLVVPRNVELKGVHRIFFASELQYQDVEVLCHLATIAKAFDSGVKVVHMTGDKGTKPELVLWMQELIKEKVRDISIEVEELPVEPNFSVLEQILQKEKIQLLVMTTKGKNMLERLVKGSLTRDVICRTDIPVLIYHIKDLKYESCSF